MVRRSKFRKCGSRVINLIFGEFSVHIRYHGWNIKGEVKVRVSRSQDHGRRLGNICKFIIFTTHGH